MGSSMVMMWAFRVSFTWLIMAASVVDLPDPVGPVTTTKPARNDAISLSTWGMPSSSSEGMSEGIRRNTAPMPR